MKKSILSLLALAGNKAAAVDIAARDLHAAIFHLCHAGQSTPLVDTLAALPNRGKSAKIRAVISDYWQAAASYRSACKADGKLDKSGRFVGLQADNIPFSVVDVTATLSEAVAVVKKAKPEPVGAVEGEAVEGEAVASVASLEDQLDDAKTVLEDTSAELLQARATIAAQKVELVQAYAKIRQLESAIEESGFDYSIEALAA